MRQDERAPFDRALQRARTAAYGAGEFVGQEGLMRATEILSLAVKAGVGPGVRVLDLCCGVGGPGRFLTRELGCAYTGVDHSPDAVGLARERAGDLACRFEVAGVPPVPAGPYDVVLLLETMLAFRDKETLVREVASALTVGGRFAFTVEEGQPLDEGERARMPDDDTVWPVPLAHLRRSLERAGLRVLWLDDCSQAHLETADAMVRAFTADAPQIAAQVGHRGLADLLTAHRLWGEWLREGRVRKFAVVAEKTPAP